MREVRPVEILDLHITPQRLLQCLDQSALGKRPVRKQRCVGDPDGGRKGQNASAEPTCPSPGNGCLHPWHVSASGPIARPASIMTTRLEFEERLTSVWNLCEQ